MRTRLVALLFAVGSLGIGSTSSAQEARVMSDSELHDLIVQHFSALSRVELPAGDTFVSWTRSPILFHTVHRDSGLVATGMLRNDGTAGTGTVTWSDGQVTSASILWTKGDSTLVEMRLEVDGDSVVYSGTTEGSFAVPHLPWVVSDYGMEDQIVPLLTRLTPGGESLLVAFRPFAATIDTLRASSQHIGNARLYTILDENGDRRWWLVGRSGHLLEMRHDGQEFVRLPLIGSRLMDEYRQLEEATSP